MKAWSTSSQMIAPRRSNFFGHPIGNSTAESQRQQRWTFVESTTSLEFFSTQSSIHCLRANSSNGEQLLVPTGGVRLSCPVSQETPTGGPTLHRLTCSRSFIHNSQNSSSVGALTLLFFLTFFSRWLICWV
jgi:hypothetical protein